MPALLTLIVVVLFVAYVVRAARQRVRLKVTRHLQRVAAQPPSPNIRVRNGTFDEAAFDQAFAASNSGDPAATNQVREFTQNGTHVTVTTSISGGTIPAFAQNILKQMGGAEGVLNMPAVQEAMSSAMQQAHSHPPASPTPDPEQAANIYEARTATPEPTRDPEPRPDDPFHPGKDPFASTGSPFDQTSSPFEPTRD